VHAAGEATGVGLQIFGARKESEIETAFAALGQARPNALVVASESLFITRREQIVELAARHALPACYPFREFVMAGGLMSYGADEAEIARQSAHQVARILKGARPGDLPVMQATKFELVINLKTAKTLRLPVARDFLARVDEVIQ
jgi:putative ABC transport system substrate-binding protein